MKNQPLEVGKTNPNNTNINNTEYRLFRMFIYNNTLFRNTQIEMEELSREQSRELSDVDALKKCVEIFCNGMTGSKEEAVILANTKQKIKDVLYEYEQFKRMNSYAKKLKG